MIEISSGTAPVIQRRSRPAPNTQRDNIIQFTRHRCSPNATAANSSGSFRTPSIESPLHLGEFSQTLLDLFALACWLFLTCLGAIGIALSIYFLVSPIIAVV